MNRRSSVVVSSEAAKSAVLEPRRSSILIRNRDYLGQKVEKTPWFGVTLKVRAPKVVLQKCRMPLYEFRCPEGHDFEKFYRSIGSAAAEEKCPVCGEVAVRLMSTAGLVFKGSGFYITDYGKDGKKAEREAASLASSTSKKADKETSSDSSVKS